MKICIVNFVKPINYGGASSHTWELAINLAKLGHEVHMVLPFMEVPNNCIFYHFIDEFNFPISKRFFYALSSVIRTAKLNKEFKFDVIYSRSFQNMVLLALIKCYLRTRLVAEVNGLRSDELIVSRHNIFRNHAINLFFDLFENKILSCTDAIVCVTDGIKKDLIERRITEKKIWVVENGVNIELFRPIADRKILKKVKMNLSINEDDKIISFVGSLKPWQGVEYIIEIAPFILKDNQKIKFLIVGNGEMLNELKKMVNELNVSNNFIFTGKIDYNDVPKYINISDICISLKKPLKSGYSTLKLFEYMACSKPVIGSNAKGIGDFLKYHNAGYGVSLNDSNELINAIKKLLQDDNLRTMMGRNGFKAVSENYSWKNSAIKISEICENLKSIKN